MKVPAIDFNEHYAPIRTEVLKAIEKVLDDHSFILGPPVNNFEEEIAAYTGTRFAIGVSSGSDALLISLMALGIGPGDEVITTPYSFFATAGCVSRLGATPVFVDIDPVSYNLDPAKLEAAITSRTKAIVPVHLYGQVSDMPAIMEIANRHDLHVVEDAAQAIGSEHESGIAAGQFGDCGCFSFFPSKNLGGMGDGGMVVTNDESLAEKLRVLRAHGSKPKYYHKVIGGNFRLDALQAAVLSVKLPHLDQWTEQRQENARLYSHLFQQAGLQGFCGEPAALYEQSGVNRYHIYNQYVIRVENRDGLQTHLQENGIETAIYYPVPFHLQECFSDLPYKKGDFPEAERAANQTLALPISPEIRHEQIEYVVEMIQGYFARQATTPAASSTLS